MIPSFYDGSEFSAYTFFGAQVEPGGVLFRVYAPNANAVSLISDYNGWQPVPMEPEENPGVWYLWMEGMRPGARYKYRIDEYGGRTRDRADPYGFGAELRPATCSVVTELNRFAFTDERWMQQRGTDFYNRPLNIYEVHMGSWRKPDGEGWYTLREAAAPLIAHVKEHGFTHIELLPLSEHPSDESWGYQVTGFFCPTARYGTAEDLQYFVNECHLAGIGVLFDFVPVHFAPDDYALYEFDGTHLYEYPFEDVGHNEWGSCNFNFSRPEVRSFLQSAAHFWLDVFHFDGLRMDAVRNAIYWQGSEARGENKDGTAFLRGLNSGLKERFPSALLIAEDSSAYLKVTAPTRYDGLGFDFKWNLGWMHDTLEFFQLPPEQRCIHYGRLCWPMRYFYNDLFLLPFSHDEVVHGKATILQRMWGDYDLKFPQGRTLYTLMFTQPGKKLNFMGNEFGQLREWDEKRQQDWELLRYPLHDAFLRWFSTLSRLYFIHPALHENEYNADSFRWVEDSAPEACVYAYERGMGDERLLVVLNLSGRTHSAFRIGFDRTAVFTEALNSDWQCYGGATTEAARVFRTADVPYKGMPYSFTVELAPFGSAIYLIKEVHMRERDTQPRGMRLKTKLVLLLLGCILLAGMFVFGAVYGGREKAPVITSDLIGEQLRSVQELVAVEYHYTNMGKFENQVDFYGWKVPFTTKSFLVSYDGLIKAGVDLGTVKAEVGADTVTITLPASEILSHEIPEDSIEVFDESHNLFNPIKIQDYTGFTAEQKEEVEQKAIAKGLLSSADEKARLAVESLLRIVPGMDEYTLTVRTAE